MKINNNFLQKKHFKQGDKQDLNRLHYETNPFEPNKIESMLYQSVTMNIELF